MFHDEKHVITGNVVIAWDGVTRPDANNATGTTAHSLKVVLSNADPTLQELSQIATKCLQESEFKGHLPQGGNWPLIAVDPTAHEGHLPAHTAFNTKTYLGAPQIVDANGQTLDPMVYGSMLYPGAIVRVLVHAYAFNKAGNKGIAFGLDGVQIVDATAPRLPGAGGIDVTAAFGGAAPVAAPAYVPPAAPGMAPAPVAPPAYVPSAAPGMPAASGAPAYTPGPATTAAPPAFVPPAAPDFLTPGGGQAPKQMTAKAAGTTYEQFIAAGWTDAQLIEQGYLLSHDGIPF